MGEPKIGFTPPITGFDEEEERTKMRTYEETQREKGWENFDFASAAEEAEIAALKQEENDELYDSREKVERLMEVKGLIDLKKIPRVYCNSTEHDQARPHGMYFLVSRELAQIADRIKQIESSGRSTEILLKDGTILPIPDDCMIFRDNLEAHSDPDGKYLVDKDDDYLDLDRARMYRFIGEDERMLEYFSKDPA